MASNLGDGSNVCSIDISGGEFRLCPSNMLRFAMTCFTEVHCPNCKRFSVKKAGIGRNSEQRYFCKNTGCSTKKFISEPESND